jgi:hypothetical protein
VHKSRGFSFEIIKSPKKLFLPPYHYHHDNQGVSPLVIIIPSPLLFDVACVVSIKRGLHGSRESVMHKSRGFTFEIIKSSNKLFL